MELLNESVRNKPILIYAELSFKWENIELLIID